jgi:hypothetical protein
MAKPHIKIVYKNTYKTFSDILVGFDKISNLQVRQ